VYRFSFNIDLIIQHLPRNDNQRTKIPFSFRNNLRNKYPPFAEMTEGGLLYAQLTDKLKFIYLMFNYNNLINKHIRTNTNTIKILFFILALFICFFASSILSFSVSIKIKKAL